MNRVLQELELLARELESTKYHQQVQSIIDQLQQLTPLEKNDNSQPPKQQQQPDKILLRIEDKLYVTSKKTLTSVPDTYFTGLFSEQFESPVDENGEIFIDRDPTHFRIILNHLRGNDVSDIVEELGDVEKKQLLEEVDYYQINSMFKFFPVYFAEKLRMMGERLVPQFDPEFSHPTIVFEDDGNKATAVPGHWSGVTTKKCSEDFTIRLVGPCTAMIGMIPGPKSHFRENMSDPNKQFKYGWYLFTSGGVYSGLSDGHRNDSFYGQYIGQEGNTIRVYRSKGQLYFQLNGGSSELGFSHVFDPELYPALYINGSTVEFVA